MYFQESGIRVKKFDKIGMGTVFRYDKMRIVDFKYEIIKSGGHLSQSDEFWAELTDQTDNKKVRN